MCSTGKAQLSGSQTWEIQPNPTPKIVLRHLGACQYNIARSREKLTLFSSVQHCSLCQDRGKLWECDKPGCEHAVYACCVEIPPKDTAKLEVPNVKFQCISCHWKIGQGAGVFYVVSNLYVSFQVFAKMILSCLQDFTIDGAPILTKLLKVQGSFEMATSTTVLSPPTLLLHFQLDSIHHIAHFTLVDHLLHEYYQDD